MAPETKRRVRDWGGILAGIAALLTAGFSYYQVYSNKTTTNKQAAKQEVQLEQAYKLLATAVNNLSNQAHDRDKIIGDMREAIGEIKGILKAERAMRREKNVHAAKPTIAADVPFVLDAGVKVKQEPIQVQMELPKVEQRLIEQKAAQLEAK